MHVWLNDRLCSADSPLLMVSERGFLLGDGLFETIRVRNGLPCFLADHQRRLNHGCDLLGMPLPPWDLIIHQALPALLEAESVVHGSLRITWARGHGGPRGLLPSGAEHATLLITASAGTVPTGLGLPGISLITATITRRNEQSPLARLKSLNYGDGLLARQQAAQRGADDAVMLNTQGKIAETSIASLFLYLEGQWWTPPVADGALPGIRRQQILRAGLAGERSLTPADLAQAEAIVTANALAVRRVAVCDGRSVPGDQGLWEWAKNSLFD